MRIRIQCNKTAQIQCSIVLHKCKGGILCFAFVLEGEEGAVCAEFFMVADVADSDIKTIGPQILFAVQHFFVIVNILSAFCIKL